MKFLHTSDWHVGKGLRGRSRHEEHRDVLAEIVGIARREQVDAVLIAGDLYDSSVPSPDAQQLVVRTLLDLRDIGAEVVAVAGNHDNARSFDAYQPADARRRNHYARRVPPARTRRGAHLLRSFHRRDGQRIALLPFLSQRYAVTAADLIEATAGENAAGYERKVRGIIAALTAGFAPDAVNILMSHLTVVGGELGGGERSAQSDVRVLGQCRRISVGRALRRARPPASSAGHSRSGSPWCTAVRPWLWTSASNRTPTWCAWSRPRPAPQPA